MKTYNYEEGLSYSIKLISRYVYTTKKLIDKLKKKNISNVDIDKIINYLTKHNLINDKEFTIEYVDELINKGKGQNYIKDKLFNKGISNNIIKESINNIDYSKLLFNLERKIITLNNKYKDKNKIINNCLRSGYYLNDINKIINKLIKDSKIKLIKENDYDLY